MDRLTHYDVDGRIYSSRGYEIALSRLAAYEDTGLTPEKITAMKQHDAAITRCGKCWFSSNIFVSPDGDPVIRCNHIGETFSVDHFCSYGRPKKNEEGWGEK